MAWRSSGTNNDEMVDNLKRFGVIHTSAVEDAFRAVDRRIFVPRNLQYMAHTDQPLKEGNIHISAPHIYGSVLEALELAPSSSLSFLNLGCGTGYLSCIVAHILGPTSRNVGIDLHASVVEHCRTCIQEWQEEYGEEVPLMDVIQGNALHIDTEQGEPLTGFDRIYVGASVERRKLPRIVKMLRLGGVFVGPVDDELVKVVRITETEEEETEEGPIPRNFRGHPPALSSDFSMQVISGVRFTPLLNSPSRHTVIPSQIWEPSIHRHYPDSFRRSCKELMLCSRSPVYQPPPQQTPAQRTNAAATLPRALWMEILSYTDRTWFEKPRSPDESLLRQRLVEEQAAAQRAHEARLHAESRLHMVERERDVYRLLALRWQTRLQGLLRERGAPVDDDSMAGIEDFAEVARAAFANEPLLLRLGSLSALMRQFQPDSDNDDDGVAYPDGDNDSEVENMDEELEPGDNDGEEEEESDSDDEVMSVTADSHVVNMGRSRSVQARTVSISGPDA